MAADQEDLVVSPRKPLNGVCCACGHSGEEEMDCPVRDVGIHCDHWWEGPDGDHPEEQGT